MLASIPYCTHTHTHAYICIMCICTCIYIYICTHTPTPTPTECEKETVIYIDSPTTVELEMPKTCFSGRSSLIALSSFIFLDFLSIQYCSCSFLLGCVINEEYINSFFPFSLLFGSLIIMKKKRKKRKLASKEYLFEFIIFLKGYNYMQLLLRFLCLIV